MRRDTDDTSYPQVRHPNKTWRPYIDAMFIPTALIAVMVLSFSVVVVLVAREVHKR
jgi:hypothetical protein